MNANRRNDLRAVAVSVAVALAFSFSTVVVLATEHDEALESGPIVPSATSEPAGHDEDAASVAATDVPANDLPSGPDHPAIASTPFKSPTLAGSAPVTSAFFDDGGKTLTMVQFPAEHFGLFFGKELPLDADAFASVLAKKGVPFAVTHLSKENLKPLMGKAGVGMTAFYTALAAGAFSSPSPDCLLEEVTWSRCYKEGLDLLSSYQPVHSSPDLDLSRSPPKLWKWRSLSPHMRTGYVP